MTRRDLSQYYYLCKVYEDAERELNRLVAESEAKAKPITGMPFQNTGTTSDPTQTAAIEITEQAEVVRGIMVSVQKKKAEIEKYMSEIMLTEPYLYLIVKFRVLHRMTWVQVAHKIGAGADAESIRKYYERKIPAK